MKIPFHIPTITGSERARIEAVLGDGRLTESDGRYSQECGQRLRTHLAVEHLLFTPSCTAALEMAALLTVDRGDEVIVPSFTFVTSVSSFTRLGAKPVFCDIRADTLNIDESLLEGLISPRTKAIVAVHYGGIACEMNAIRKIAASHQLSVVEDAAQALSGRYRNRPLGSIGDLACFSFHHTKNYHCGEGGALVVNRPEWLAAAEIHREKGTNRKAFQKGQTDKYTWVGRGSSYVPSELTMAFLAGQLEHIGSIQARRKLLFQRYLDALRPLETSGLLRLPIVPPECEPSYHLLYVLLNEPGSRDALLEHLLKREVGATFHYVPLHSSPEGRRLHDGRALPVTDDAADRLLRLPLYPDLGHDDVDVIADLVYEFFGRSR